MVNNNIIVNGELPKSLKDAISRDILSGLATFGEGRYDGYSFGGAWDGVVSEATISFPCLVIPEKENLMYVYDVVVISKQSDGIVFDSYIVARSKDAAKLIALAHVVRDVKPTDEEIDDYHFAISQVGDGYTK